MRCRQWSNDSREFRGLLLDEPSSMIIHSTEKSSAILWYWGFLVMECNARWFSVITISHRVIDQLGSNHASVFTMSTIWFVHNNHYKCTASFTITDDPPFIWRVSMPIFHKSSLWYSQWTGYGRCLTGVCTMHSFHMSSASRIFNDWWEKKKQKMTCWTRWVRAVSSRYEVKIDTSLFLPSGVNTLATYFVCVSEWVE